MSDPAPNGSSKARLRAIKKKWRAANPDKVREAKRKHYDKNRDRLIAKYREYRQLHKNEINARRREGRTAEDARRHRARQLRVNYGLSMEEYQGLERSQRGVCAICGSPQTGRFSNLAVDHDHDSGKVRGLLCANCNISLGRMHESPDRLRGAAAYLEWHKQMGGDLDGLVL